MIKFEEAYKIVIGSNVNLQTEKIKFQNSLGRVLAEDIFSDINMPPFDKSAMDGFACRATDLYNELEIIETIQAGKTPKKEIGKNQCSKIMTGAPIPIGADTVFIIEDSKIINENKVIYTKKRPNVDACSIDTSLITKSNICSLGEDIKKGDKVLSKGTLIKPQHIAILATVGRIDFEVAKKVKVGVISTGSELVEPNKIPKSSQIRNSNGSQMISQLNDINVIANYYGIAVDDDKITFDIMNEAIKNNDIVMISGGVSEGEFDFVPFIMKKLNFEILFDRVAVQPGKPTTFATDGTKYIFGMPGNPVSSFVQFELLAKPLIYKMMGLNYKPPKIIMPLAKTYSRKRAKRMSWIPVTITDSGEVLPLEYHGSAHINGLSSADAIMPVSVGTKILEKGTFVELRLI